MNYIMTVINPDALKKLSDICAQLELVRLFPQSLYLFFYLLVLAVNPAEQGSDFVICFVFERVLEVERVERLNYLF